MKKEKTANDWLSEMMESAGTFGKPEEVPDGWLTIKQMQDATGFAQSTMNGRVQRWIKQGLIEKKKFRIQAGHQIIPIWHYIKK